MSTYLKILRHVKNFLAQFALIALILEQFLFVSISSARAADLPITPNGSTNTQIDRAANNVPIVNIAAPNAGGLSHNKYTDYNVNQQGLILNNATGSQNGIVQTQIGGLINENANLKNSGSASIILNEVTSNNISQINGYTEIAGAKADLILANPNGIQMNGAGFINVSRLTAIVGSSNQFNPHPNDLTFSLSNHSQINSGFLPKLTIQGAGLDLEAVSATDLVASMMNIIAPIYGGTNEINLRTGDQIFNYANKTVSSDNSNPGSNLPDQLAIDASALGKIQAGRIYVIASKEGFGIKWDADMLASRSGINIDNQGNITYKNLASEAGNIEVTSRKGSITQTGISQTKDLESDIKLNAFGNIVSSGQFLSAQNINLETSATFRNESSITNFSSNDFIIKAADLVNLGTLAANRDLKIEATSSITNSKELVAKRVLELTAVTITNDDSIYGSSKISITATNSLTNNKDIISIGVGVDDGINIVAKTLNNNKQIAAATNVTISSDQLNNNTLNSTILALNDITLNITSLDNSNSIQALNNLAIRNLKLNNPDAASLLLVTSQSSSITNGNGSLFAGSLLDIDLGNSSDYTISGTVESAGNIKIKANNITNQTAVKANGYIKVEATNQFINGSLGGDNSNIQFITGTYLDITAQNLLSNYGTLSANTNLTLTQTQINNLQKDIIWFETQTIDGATYIVPKIYLTQTTRDNLKNGNLASKSTIYAASDVNITSTGGKISNNGSIIAGNNVTLSASGNILNKNFSEINAGNALSLTSSTGSISNFSQLKAGGALSLTAATDVLNSSTVNTNDKDLLASGNSAYVNQGFGAINEAVHKISSETLETAGITAGSLTVNAGNNFTNQAANITTTGNATITAGNDTTFTTLELRNRTEESWGHASKGGSRTIDTTTNVASNVDVGGNLSITTTGLAVDSATDGGSDINVFGSNVSATGNLNLAAKDEVNIKAAQNTSYSESRSWNQGLTVSKSSVSGSESTTNVLSNLTSDSGNISITSGSNTNLIGAKLKAEDVTINAGDEVNIYSVSDQNKSWSSSNKSRSLSGITGGLVSVGFIANVVPLTLGGLILANQGLSTNDSSKSSSQTAEKTSNLASVIDASGAVSIAANQDLTVLGSNISGKTGSLVSDQGSVNILAAQEIEKTTSSNSETARATSVPGFKGVKHTSSKSTENITNIASNLTFTDSLAIQTNGNSLDSEQKADVNIKGSNLTVTDGDLTIASKGNVTIENAIDSAFKESSSKKRNETTKSFSESTDYVETAASSNLSANNINISSLGDTTIQGSNVDTKENLIIGSFTIAQNSDGSYQKDANGNYVTTAGTTVDNLTIKDDDLKEYHYAQSGKGYTGVAGAAMRALPYALAPLQIASSLTKDYMSTYFPDFYEDFVMKASLIGLSMKLVDKAGDEMGAIKISQSNETRTDKTNSYASNINVGGSMMTNSVGDTLIKGSNLNISGDLLANSLGSFTVAAGTNAESATSQSSYETAGKFHSEYQSTKLNYRAGVTKDFVEEGGNSSSSTVASSNVNIGGSALVNSSDEFALLASNFVTGSSAEIIAKNNFNVLDGQNKQSSSSYLDKLTLDTGIQVGNAYADAAYAVVDAVKAQKAVKDAYDKLEKIEDLKGQGMASSKAVERAKYQVVLALINAGLSSAAAMQAVGNAGQAASTSMGTGFYGSVYADITKLKSTTTSEYSQSVASNLIAGTNLALTSGAGDINITGSNVSATNGDLNLTAMLGNLNVNAGESTASQSYKMRSQSLGGSVGNNGFSANIGMNEAESSFDQTTYTNSQILAQNGSLNINTGKDTNLFGANLLASNVNMDVGGNLLLKSRQNLSESDSYNIGMSLGVSGDSSGASGGSVGFNLGNGYSNRAWVNQVSSIIGTNSVNINVANNTNIVGALIANKDKQGVDLGNLNLSTDSLTYSDLKNFLVSESNQLGLNLNAGYNPKNPTQNGNLAINLSMQGSESSSDTKATIGQGNISVGGSLNDETKLAGLNRDIDNTEQNKKTVVTSDFEAELKIDLRLIAAAGNLAIGNTDKAAANLGAYKEDVKKGYDILTSEEAKYIYGKIWASPNTILSVAWGAIGVTAGAIMGRDVAITFDHNAIQFEGNPLVSRAFTLGNATNYPTVGDSYGGPDDVLGPSYTREFYRATVGDHEEPHTYQAEREGPFFIPLYVVDGMMNAKNANPPQSPFSFPGHNGNKHEIEADNQAITKE